MYIFIQASFLQEEARDDQEEAQDGKDETQEGQDEAEDKVEEEAQDATWGRYQLHLIYIYTYLEWPR